MNGEQAGDPDALVGAQYPPQRWVAGGDVVATVEQKAKDVHAHSDISSNLAHHHTQPNERQIGPE